MELSLDVRELFEDFAPRPQQYLKKHQNIEVFEAQSSSSLSWRIITTLESSL